jgi:prevent-host-death family protein
MVHVSLAEAAADLQKLIARSKRSRRPIAIGSPGKEVAVLLSAEAWEDLQDGIAADKALAEWEAEGRPTVSLGDIKKRLGMP